MDIFSKPRDEKFRLEEISDVPHSSAASMLASGPAVANVKPKLQAGSWTSFALFTLAVQ